jgi:tetraacyldisaccharide 4'-kinase
MGFLRVLLSPLALLYGFAIFCRNLLFDIRLLPSKKYSIPIISVGNLRTGGTGKTPHVEYLISLLHDKYNIAVLSRGYKRKTNGYAEARPGSTTAEIGDEPLQMHQKFPDILVAVHGNRRKGIREILSGHPEINLIILDDAFQHRYVRPGLNLLLTGYYNPFFKDYLLPVGHLRDFKSRAKHADALIVTKTPFVFSPLDRRFFMKKLKKFKPKSVFFSKFNYQVLHPVTPLAAKMSTAEVKTIFLLSGIANTIALEEYLKTCCTDFFAHKYPDHHQFTIKDLEKLRYHFDKTISYSKIIVTTEKDAMRLIDPEIRDYIADLPVFTLPVEVAFHDSDKQDFDTMVHRFLSSYAK